MRLLYLTILLFSTYFCFGQITFEEISAPDDVSVTSMYQSPSGEYFLQVPNDKTSIYSSFDGENWTKESLPHSNSIKDIDKFIQIVDIQKKILFKSEVFVSL